MRIIVSNNKVQNTINSIKSGEFFKLDGENTYIKIPDCIYVENVPDMIDHYGNIDYGNIKPLNRIRLSDGIMVSINECLPVISMTVEKIILE